MNINHLLHVIELPGSREEMVAYLQKNAAFIGLELFGEMETLLAIYKTHLPEILLQHKLSFYTMVDNVTDECTHFVEAYLPTQVKVNPVIPFLPSDNEDSKDKQIVAERAQNAMKDAALRALMCGIYSLNLPPELMETLMVNTQAAFDNPESSHLKAPSTFTPAMLLARRKDSPIFGSGARSLMDGLAGGDARPTRDEFNHTPS